LTWGLGAKHSLQGVVGYFGSVDQPTLGSYFIPNIRIASKLSAHTPLATQPTQAILGNPEPVEMAGIAGNRR
jgi:hypothetical protein